MILGAKTIIYKEINGKEKYGIRYIDETHRCFDMSTISNFYEDVKKANADEQFITELLNINTLDYTFEWVGDNKDCWHYGDIKIEDSNGSIYYADVKSDDTIWRTGNILAEHRVKFRSTGWREGFMQNSHYDYVFYLSKVEKIIYVIDFKKWQELYKEHYKRHIEIPHNDKNGCWLQTTDAYLMSVTRAKEHGVIVTTLKYDDEMNLKEID